MESLRKLEAMMSGWYKDMPHLPKNVREWIAHNVWWLTLIGVILGAIGVASLIMLTFFAGALLAGFGGPVGAVVGGLAVFVVMAALLFSVAGLIIGGMSITPLKEMRKKGWTLLFILVLLRVAAQAVEFIFTLNLFSLVWGVLFAAVGAYFLFEIRNFFVDSSARRSAKPKKAKTV